MHAVTQYDQILDLVNYFDPTDYARTRNYTNGNVSRLSAYISRGVISTKLVRDNLAARGVDLVQVEKFVQELAWRDYWQQIWVAQGEGINEDLKQPQVDVEHHDIPRSITTASTDIQAIDSAIVELYDTGYMHNHVRMYVAALACNFGRSHWRSPAKWLYYHLLDADWASNALSWQWVAGANSNKKYIADQKNVNRYTNSYQSGTFLDGAYDHFGVSDVPPVLKQTVSFDYATALPTSSIAKLDSHLPTYLYNWYNLDPMWGADVDANRVLLVEPSMFDKLPISPRSVQFMLDLSQNITGLQIAVCEFDQLADRNPSATFRFKEHPLNQHYVGEQQARDWMSSVSGHHSSFFKFWKLGKEEFLQRSA